MRSKKKSVRKDLFVLVLTALICMVAVFGVFAWKLHIGAQRDVEIAKSSDLKKTATEIQVLFLRARRAEHDFLLRKDISFIDLHSTIFADLILRIDELEARLPEKLASFGDDLVLLRRAAEDYQAKFDQLVQLHLRLGLTPNSGLEGALRRAVHSIEDLLDGLGAPELEAKMLMMRRYEKDFIMRVDPKYIDRLDARVAEFRSFSSTNYPSPEIHRSVLLLLDAYHENFHRYAKELFAARQMHTLVSESFATSEPVLATLLQVIDAHLAEELGKLGVADTASTAVAALILIAAVTIQAIWSVSVARRIATPLSQTSEAIKELAKGNIDAAPPDSNYSEIARISNAFGVFREAMKERILLAETKAARDAAESFNKELGEAVQARTAELETANVQLRYLAETDGLTGLYNRAHFDRLLVDAVEPSNGSASLLLLDVDHFKQYNDLYGHQAGDEALITVSALMRQVGEENDCRVARYGGEEFAILINAGVTSAKRVASAMHTALDMAAIRHEHSTTAPQLTVSIGIASTGPDRSHTPEKLASDADDALYEAKRSGRNRTVVSNPEIRQNATNERNMVGALLEGLENQEFQPFLQPQVNAHTGELVGAEALVRWLREDGEIITPESFMPVALQSGLIAKVDVMMLEKLHRFLSDYPGTLPRLSFNLVSKNLGCDEYLNAIVDLAGSTQTQIAVELLETDFIDQPSDHFRWQLEQLLEAGIEIELDDFGTGRTSILGLMAVLPKKLKIARELIEPMEVDLDQSHLVSGVLSIANALSVDVLAEGVETKEVADRLVEIGCPIQQGYLHGRPLSFEDFLLDRIGNERGASQYG